MRANFRTSLILMILSIAGVTCGRGNISNPLHVAATVDDANTPAVAQPEPPTVAPSMPTGMTNQGPSQGNMPADPLPPSTPVPDPNASAPMPGNPNTANPNTANPNTANPNTANPNTTVPTAPPLADRWLQTIGNHILRTDGTPWMGRGVNLFDTRGCGACLQSAPNPAEVMRRADYLVQNWRTNFIRLDLESYASASGRVQWGGVLVDPAYVADIQAIVNHITANPNTYVLLTLLVNPTFDAYWVPTQATVPEWSAWAKVFANNPQVMFGICNEPHGLDATETDAVVWSAISANVAAIRAVEDAAKVHHHLISAQGTNGWSRDLTYYLTHPIQSDNIIYESHPYENTATFEDQAFGPAKTLPVIIGEFGYWPGAMDYADCMRLMHDGDAAGVPYISWAFHPACGIALLTSTTADTCGVGEAFTPSAWGAVNSTHMQAMNGRQTGIDPTAGLMRAVQDANYCLTARGGAAANGTPLELQPCTGSAAQKFSWVGNQLKVLGVCVDDSGGNTANGTLLQVWACDSNNANQQWTLDGGQLRLASANKCIDISGFNASPGVQLNLWDCLAGINQLWQMFDAP